MPRHVRFWVTVTIIGLAHIAAFVGLVRWSRDQKKPSLQEVIWMSGGTGNAGEAGITVSVPPSPAVRETPQPTAEITTEPSPRKQIENHPDVAPPKSDIEMPTPTPAPTATPASKPTGTPKPAPKATSKPTAKKGATSQASPKPEVGKQESVAKKTKQLAKLALKKKKSGDETSGELDKPAKKASAAQGSGKSGGAGGGGHSNGAGSASEFGWYGNMLHDRFYSEWEQPTTVVASGAKLSALVRLRIEKSGRVSDFTIIRPSGNVVIDESVAAVAKRVTQVDPLPAGLGGDHYDVRINFELNPE